MDSGSNILAVLAALVAGPGTSDTTVVVFGNAEATAAELQVTHTGEAELLSPAEVARRLVGSPNLDAPDVAALDAMLSEGRELEARFEDAAAADLRENILEAFHSARRLDRELRRIANEAAFEHVAAALVIGDEKEAAGRAALLFDRFELPGEGLPRIAPSLFARVERLQERAAKKRIHPVVVTSDRDGELFADGICLGELRGRAEVRLAVGPHRLWLASEGGTSLPYPIEVERGGAEVRIDFAVDRAVSLADPLRVRCSGDECRASLEALRERLGVGCLLGVDASDQSVLAMGDCVDRAEGLVLQAPARGRGLQAISPWYLVPFGGGQIAQDRPVFGGAYLAVQVGLASWNLWSRYRWLEASHAGNQDRAEALRNEQNLSFVLFASAVVAAVAEAVIYGIVFGE